MKFIQLTNSASLILLISTGLLSGCGGGGGSSTQKSNSVVTNGYSNHILVSDGAVAADHVDKNLLNPWGIAFEQSGPVWVANNKSQTSTLYDGNGAAQSLLVTIPSGKNGPSNPTGVVLNVSQDFLLTSGTTSAPAQFIFDGEGGTISGWSPNTGNTTIITYDDGAGGAVYKGLALSSVGGSNFLYAADFHNNKIDVFNSHFVKMTTSSHFFDPNIPSGYAPFGIQNIQGNLIVTYAKQMAPENHDEVVGTGLGYIDLFDSAGNLLKRIASAGVLNAPWGVALAPGNFGQFSNDLLIGNLGDGRINAFSMTDGQFMGTLSLTDGSPISTGGLWGIAFGNGVDNQPTNTLFYDGGINHGSDGVYGRIDAVAMTTQSSGNSSGY